MVIEVDLRHLRFPGVALPALLLASLTVACGSSGGDVLYIDAPTTNLKVGERISLALQATEVLAAPAEWDVQELEGGSLVRTTGQQNTYLAPPLAGTYHIVVRAVRANGQKVRAVQVMVVQANVSVEPASVRLAPGESCTFTARVKGLRDPKILWTVEDGDGGQVTQGGMYTAPSQFGYYQVTATVQTDDRPTATATVRVE